MAEAKVLVPARATKGRVLLYTYNKEDHCHPEMLEDEIEARTRPAIVTNRRATETGDVYDVVVYTAGMGDFTAGRAGVAGVLVRRGLSISNEPADGALHWPTRS
jgi:hypothetical protein